MTIYPIQLRQLRNNKRHEVLQAKRAIGGEGVPPHLIVIIPLAPSLEAAHIFRLLTSACDCEDTLPFSHTSTVVIPIIKQRFTLAFPPLNDLYALLDTAKVLLVILCGVPILSVV